MKLGKLVYFLAAILLTFATQVGVAKAAHVDCGQVITQSTTLDADVGPCPGEGIVIDADNITLDLGGHSILGTGTSSGIVVTGHHLVRIANGTVAGFADGVRMSLGSNNAIEHLVVRDNVSTGIALAANRGNLIRSNLITNNGASGIGTAASSENLIESNIVRGNGGAGVGVGGRSLNFLASGNRLRENWISDNAGDGVLLGLRLVTNTEIVANVISDNGRNGILVSVFSFDQCCDLIQDNVIWGNGANGVLIQGNRPLSVPASLNNEILTNNAFSNGAFDLADENPGCDNNTWAGNTFGTRNQPCIN